MYLTKEQMKTYEDNGFILLPKYFSPTEVERIKAEFPALLDENPQRKVFEKDGYTVRSVHGSHTTSKVFQSLSQHPRLVKPAMQILESKVYVYQFKINVKAAFSGDVWEWHQDYIFWLKEDGMPTARVTNVVIFLDDMNEFNGPLFVIPGSHKEGMIDVAAQNVTDTNEQSTTYSSSPGWISNFTASLTYSLNRDIVSDLVFKYGISSIKALAGSALFFSSNIVHASPNNISPFERTIVIVTFNSTENIPSQIENPRPEFLVSRDYRPVEPLSDDALLLT